MIQWVARLLGIRKRRPTILCTDPACTSRGWKHSHAEGWPEHPSYKGPDVR